MFEYSFYLGKNTCLFKKGLSLPRSILGVRWQGESPLPSRGKEIHLKLTLRQLQAVWAGHDQKNHAAQALVFTSEVTEAQGRQKPKVSGQLGGKNRPRTQESDEHFYGKATGSSERLKPFAGGKSLLCSIQNTQLPASCL